MPSLTGVLVSPVLPVIADAAYSERLECSNATNLRPMGMSVHVNKWSWTHIHTHRYKSTPPLVCFCWPSGTEHKLDALKIMGMKWRVGAKKSPGTALTILSPHFPEQATARSNCCYKHTLFSSKSFGRNKLWKRTYERDEILIDCYASTYLTTQEWLTQKKNGQANHFQYSLRQQYAGYLPLANI